MAENSRKYLDSNGLSYALQQLKTKIDESYANKEYVMQYVMQYVEENQLAVNNGSVALLTIPKSDMDVMLEDGESELIFSKITYDENRTYYIEYDGKVYPSTSVSKNYIEFNYYGDDGFYVELDSSSSKSSVMCFYYFKYYLGYVDPDDYEEEPPTPATATDMVIKYDDIKYLDNNLLDENLQVKNSLSVGVRNGEIGGGSTVTGAGNQASGTNSFAQGEGNKATGLSSSAMGSYTTAEAPYAHAEGYKTSAFGTASHIEGTGEFTPESLGITKNSEIEDILSAWENSKFSLAKGEASHVEGKDNLALGIGSHAEGISNISSGYASHAEGYETVASGDESHAEGVRTYASHFAHAEGMDTQANGEASHAEGTESVADWNNSHAEGYKTYAGNTGAHSEGSNTRASGYASHAEGWKTKASSDYQHAQGQYNIEDATNTYAHIVGNGTADNARSNAHTLDWDGNAWYAGNVTVGADKKELATEEYVDENKFSGDYNDLTNVPIKDDRVFEEFEITFDGNFDGREFVEVIPGEGYVKVSDTCPPVSEGVTVDFDLFYGEETMSSSSSISKMMDGLFTISQYVMFSTTNVSIEGMEFSEGVYFVYSGSEMYISKIVINAIISGELVQLDSKFLQDHFTIGNRKEGVDLPVSGYSLTVGRNNVAERYSVATGDHTEATGLCSHAEGVSSKAEGSYSHAEGCGARAVEPYTHAEGAYTVAYAAGSHAEGYGNIAVGYNSHIEGYSPYSADEALGINKEDIGSISDMSNSDIIAAWDKTRFSLAKGDYSHAEGSATLALDDCSHAEGSGTIASGDYGSHSEGYWTRALGKATHAEGYQTIASSEYQHVQGKNNIEDTDNKYAHIVGNGASGNARSNAHTLDWNGNAWFAGNVTVGTDNKELATKEYVDEAGFTLAEGTEDSPVVLNSLTAGVIYKVTGYYKFIETSEILSLTKPMYINIFTRNSTTYSYVKFNSTGTNPCGIYVVKLADGTYTYHSLVREAQVLTKTNTTEYTPISDYHPTTKKYVDDVIAANTPTIDEDELDAAIADIFK